MSYEIDTRIEWARECRAIYGPSRAGKGPKGFGVRYERQVAKQLPGARHGIWFEFGDEKGKHNCQPDFIFSHRSNLHLVIECKYTWVAEAHTQLDKLYLPVVATVTGGRTCGLVVCKRLTTGMHGVEVVGDLGRAIELACQGTPKVVWHYIGNVPISRNSMVELQVRV